MIYFSHIRAGLIASALLLTTALASPALAETLPEISPRQIASDVKVQYHPETGEKEYLAPSFDPFEEDRSMAGTASLSSVSNRKTIDGQTVRGGALLDMTFYYNSASNDPYDTRGYDDAVYLSGEYAPVMRRDNRILECNEQVQDVVYYHEDYYRPSLYVNLFRPYRHYSGHHRYDRGYGYGRGYRGTRGYGSIRRGTRNRIRNRRNTRDLSVDRTVDRARRTRGERADGEARRDRDDRANRETRRERNGRRTRDRNRRGVTDRSVDRTRDESANGRRTRGERADRREIRRDRNVRGTRDRIRREGRADTPRTDRVATGATPSVRDANRAETRNTRSDRNRRNRGETRRARLPRLENNDAPQVRNAPPRAERAAPPPPRAERSRPARAERAVNRAREIKSRNAPKRGRSIKGRNKLKLMSFLPMASSWSRNAVRNVDVQCAREEMLTVHIPQERLDAARFDGLTVLVLDRAGQETPVYVPANYIEGFRQAVDGRVTPNVSYQEPRSSAPVTRGPVYQEQRPYTVESAPCPVGTTKQDDGTCLQGNATAYGGYPTR